MEKQPKRHGCFFRVIHFPFGGKRLFSLPLRGRTLTARWVRVHHDANIERFYTTVTWRKCRNSFLQDKGGLCELCLSKGLITPAVHVHHKIHITPDNLNDAAITLSHDNLMALCEECHQEQHRTRRWRCDETGHIRL